MRFILVLFLHVSLFAYSYNFDEIKFISAVGTDFKQSGNIEILENKIVITYKSPKFKQIVKTNDNISIEGSSGNIYTLKGKALFYTNFFIGIMIRLSDFDELKNNEDFNVEKNGEVYNLEFKGDVSDAITKAEVITKNSNVISFKMFMPNEDTLQIIKK